MDATATAKLALDASGLDRGLQSATASLDKFAKQTGSVLAGAFAFDKLIAGFSSAIEKGDQFQDLANRFGVTAESLQEIGNAASLSGGSVEDVAGAMNKLARNAGEAIGGNTKLEATFARIGVSFQDLQTLSPQDLFYKLSQAISSGAIPANEQLAVASDLAGKSVGSLMETLRMGPDAIQTLGQSMGVMSNETVSSLSELSDQIKIFQTNMTMAFGTVASLLNPFIKGLQDALEVTVMLGAAVAEVAKGNFDAAGEIYKRASGLGTEKMADKQKSEQAKKSPSGISSGISQETKSQKEIEKQEKDAIKERTDRAMQILKEEDAEKKLANDSYERKRDIERDRMLEAANLEVKAAQEKMKAEKEQADKEKGMAAGPGGTSRQFEQARAGTAGEVLNFASGLGDRGISSMVDQERKKAAKEQQQVNRKEFDAKVMEQTSGTTKEGYQRDMTSRRREFIKKEAQKEAKGTKSLSDIYQVLDTALQKIIASPIVAV
jgi:hypothetical protein